MANGKGLKKPKGARKGGGAGSRGTIGVITAAAVITVLAVQWYITADGLPEPVPQQGAPKKHRKLTEVEDEAPKVGNVAQKAGENSAMKRRVAEATPSRSSKHDSTEWLQLSRDMPECLKMQELLMTQPVEWTGFHALCLDTVTRSSVELLLHKASGDPSNAKAEEPTRRLAAKAKGDGLLPALIDALKEELLAFEFQHVDNMISTSDFDFEPNPWKLFTSVGIPVESDEDLLALGAGASIYLYTGGQFIWPGVRIGHKTRVPIPVNDGSPGGHRFIEMTTLALRPTAFVLSGFLTDEECAFIKGYAKDRMVPSGLATMDSTTSNENVRTSTQTFMERGGTPQIRALEERAHNLTRLPWELGENIQVVRYKEGQKYGAHRDFFNPNDYHKQPGMLRSVEYGGRNRLATVFWYLETVTEGGETFFPRALNEQGKEYHPWNGNHDDCYRGAYVPPIRGNAVLFYSMLPDGRLDERSLHGGCRPSKAGVEKWGANQWIWNHPQRTNRKAPLRKRNTKRRMEVQPGCVDLADNCDAWAEGGECSKNPEYMESNCAAACGTC